MANATDRWLKYRTPLNEWIPAGKSGSPGEGVICPVSSAGDDTRKQLVGVGQ
jgi:hypothetical protein